MAESSESSIRATAIVSLFALTAVLGAAAAPQGDTATTPARLDVASIKPNRSGDARGSMRGELGGRVIAINMPLRTLITFAYRIPLPLLAGGPPWVAEDRFDITGTLEGGVPGAPSPDAMASALRALLADRFGLTVHRETREEDVFALVQARAERGPGPSLQPSTQDCSPEAIQSRRANPPPPAPSGGARVFCGMQIGPGRIAFGGLPLSRFAAGSPDPPDEWSWIGRSSRARGISS